MTTKEIEATARPLEPEYLGMLRRIAESATQEKWWVTEQPWGDGTSVHAGPSEDPHGQRLSVCMFDVMSEQFNSAFDGVDCDDIEAEGRRNMRHIAAFDPRTCLEILESYDATQQELAELRSGIMSALLFLEGYRERHIVDANFKYALLGLRSLLKKG